MIIKENTGFTRRQTVPSFSSECVWILEHSQICILLVWLLTILIKKICASFDRVAQEAFRRITILKFQVERWVMWDTAVKNQWKCHK